MLRTGQGDKMNVKEKREKKIEYMLEAFIPLFSKHGMDKTSIKMLADSVDRNVALLYQYFVDKDDMIAKCTQYHHNKIEEELITILFNNIDNPDRMCRATLDFIDSKRDICRFLVQVLAHPTYSFFAEESGEKISLQLKDFSTILKEKYKVSTETALGISFGINSIINNYILRENKEIFLLQFNVLIAPLCR